MLAAVEKAFSTVAKSERTTRGVIHILANESLSTYALPQVLMQARIRLAEHQVLCIGRILPGSAPEYRRCQMRSGFGPRAGA